MKLKTLPCCCLFLFSLSLNYEMEAQRGFYYNGTVANKVRYTDFDSVATFIIDDNIGTSRDMVFDHNMGYLFYVDQTGQRSIRRYDKETEEIKHLALDLNNPSRIAISRSEQLVFYTIKGENSIYSMNYDGSDVKLLTSNLVSPVALAVDDINKIIFVEEFNFTISRMNFKGKERSDIATDLANIGDFEIHVNSQTIFYTERDSSRISKMKYDGTDRQVLYAMDAAPPTISLDCENELIYFPDANKVVSTIDFQGENHQIVSEIGHISFLTYEKEDICDQTSTEHIAAENIVLLYPNPSSDQISIVSDLKDIHGIEIFDLNGILLSAHTFNPSNEFAVSVQDLTPGMKLLKVEFENNQVAFKRFIKM